MPRKPRQAQEAPPPQDGEQRAIWQAQPGPQSLLQSCPVEDVMFGGATGGGKTYGLLLNWLIHASLYPGLCQGIMFRRTYKELDDIIEESHRIYGATGMGWKYLKSEKQWRSPEGDLLRLRYLDRDDDWRNYWGHSYDWMGVDEAGNFPSPAPFDKLRARLRSAKGVPCLFRCTANPGGPGHGWIKRRYVDRAPPMTPFRDALGVNPITGKEEFITRVYIPSRVTDNSILMSNNPEYMRQIMASGTKEQVRAWLTGDWDAQVGQYFREFSEDRHIVLEHEIPSHWPRFVSLDWGSKAPFSLHWHAVSDGSLPQYPSGAVVTYREWYGGIEQNGKWVGLGLTANVVAAGIKEREQSAGYPEKIAYRVADYQIFAKSGSSGPTVAEDFGREGVHWRPADKNRVAGWQQITRRLRGTGYGTDDWRPMWYVMSSCQHLIRTLPVLMHDDDHPEDVLQGQDIEDHAPDDLRYALMSRIYVRPVDQPRVQKVGYDIRDLLGESPEQPRMRLRSY